MTSRKEECEGFGFLLFELLNMTSNRRSDRLFFKFTLNLPHFDSREQDDLLLWVELTYLFLSKCHADYLFFPHSFSLGYLKDRYSSSTPLLLFVSFSFVVVLNRCSQYPLFFFFFSRYFLQ